MKISLEGGSFPVLKAWIYGYGRAQVFLYKCYSCKDGYFAHNKNEFSNCLCELCHVKNGEINILASNSPYCEILGFKQNVDIFFKRSRYNYNKVLKRDDYICQYCYYNPRISAGNKIIPMHVDHIIPFSKTADNSMKNLVTACQWCNICASNKVFSEFIDKKIFIVEKRRENNLPVGSEEWREHWKRYLKQHGYLELK